MAQACLNFVVRRLWRSLAFALVAPFRPFKSPARARLIPAGVLIAAGVALAVLAVQAGLLDLSSTARAACTVTGEPTVVTDKDDYLPNETVLINGCGFEAYEAQTLTLKITRPDGASSTQGVTIASGKFSASYVLNGIVGTYLVEVLDASSNVITATSFTDHFAGTVLIRDSSDAFGADSYTTDSLSVTMDITWFGSPDVTQARFLNDITPEDACPPFVAESWLPISEIGTTNTATFGWTLVSVTDTGLRKVCSQTAHGALGTPEGTLSHEDVIFFRRPNVALAQKCGLDIVVIMDNSGSIDSAELSQMKTAVNGFVTALMPETPTETALVTFNTSAMLVQGFTASESTMTGAVNGVPTTGGFTNWDDALADGRALLPHRAGNPDLIIMASDGNPNRRGGHSGLLHSPVVSAVSAQSAMAWATAEANEAKLNGARILGIGIGAGLNLNNFIAIAGTSVHPPDAISTSVDVITSDFSTMASDLANFAKALCGGTVTVNKVIDGDGNLGTTGDQSAGANWTFNCNAGPDSCTPGSGDTGTGGSINFAINLGGDNAATVTITEPGEPGFGFVSASCTKNSNPVGTPGSSQVSGIMLGPADIVTCTFYNTLAGTVIVEKQTDPDGAAGSFTFTGTPSGTIGDNGQLTASVAPGTYTSTENDPGPVFILKSIVCSDSDSSGNLGTRTATFVVAAAETVKCTFTNQKTGTIIIRKDAKDGANENPSQDFHYVCTTLGGFDLDDDGAEGNPLNSSKTFNYVTPGSYDCSEDQVSGWMMQIACLDPDNGRTVSVPTAHIDIDAGETVECTFTNSFIPGQNVAVGGIAGLLDPKDAPGVGSVRQDGGRLPAAGLGLLSAAFAAAFAIGLLAVRRRTR